MERVRHVVQADLTSHESSWLQPSGDDQVEERRISVGRHAMTPEELEFPGDDGGHRNGRMGVFAKKKAHLNVASARTQPENGASAGFRVAQGIQGDVGAAVGEITNLGDRVGGRGRFEGVDDPKITRGPERLAADIDGDDLSSRGKRDHGCGKSHASAAVDHDPFAGTDLSQGDDGAERGDEAATETGRLHEIERVREPDEIAVGVSQRDEFGEGTPTGESGLELVQANLGIPGQAGSAMAAATDKRHGDTISHLPAMNGGADGFDGARQFMAGHMGKPDVGIMALPGVPVTSADARGVNAYDDAIGGGGGIRDLRNRKRATKLIKPDGVHGTVAGWNPWMGMANG